MLAFVALEGFLTLVEEPEAVPLALVESVHGTVTVVPDGRLEDRRLVQPGQTMMKNDRLITGDARLALRTRDGASLRLDRASTMDLEGARVMVLQRGALYLDSGSSPGHSYLVQTALGGVEDVGTQFEVRLMETSLRVRIREGEVVLRQGGREFRGRRGEEVRVEADASVQRRRVPVNGPDWQWIMEAAPFLDLSRETLETYLLWVAREGGYELEIADVDLSREASAILLHGDTQGLLPTESLAVVLPACGLVHEVRGSTLAVHPADRP
jgi:hypothetical protein